MVSKQLDIDFYEDGLSEVEFNCVDIPIAGACGYYQRKNYYLYLLQLCINVNWMRIDQHKESMFQCVRNIGLELEDIWIEKEEELIQKIKEQLNKNRPVLLPVTYYEMFFCTRYKRNIASHLLLVDGYVEDHEIILLREEINFISAEQLRRNKGLYPLRLKEYMVTEMWKLSQTDLVERLKNRIFTVRPLEEACVIKSIEELLERFFNEYDSTESIFNNFLLKTEAIHSDELDTVIFRLRNDHYKFMYAFFYLLERSVAEKVRHSIIEELEHIKNEYLEYREWSISRFHISMIKKIGLNRERIIDKTKYLDQKLYNLLQQILCELKNPVKKDSKVTKEVNLACSCQVVSSSCEHDIIKSPSHVLVEDNNIWKSARIEPPHWISFEFPEQTAVHKLIITHHPEVYKMTVDFMIQGSLDGKEWEELERIENNFLPVTEHELKGKEYKFIRIYIVLPSLRGKAAIIRHIRII